MTEVIGLIEIDSGEHLSAPGAVCDEATLDGLFAQLLGAPAPLEDDGNADDEPAIMQANLDSLAADLRRATREVLTEIFQARGRRA